MPRSRTLLLAGLALVAAVFVAVSRLDVTDSSDAAPSVPVYATSNAPAMEGAASADDAPGIATPASAAGSRATDPHATATIAAEAASGRIQGLVRGGRSGHEPLAGARLSLRRRVGDERVLHAATADANGRFSFTGLSGGGWFLHAQHGGHSMEVDVVRIAPEDAMVAVDLELAMRREITVRVVGSKGEPRPLSDLGLRPEFQHLVRLRVLEGSHAANAPPTGSIVSDLARHASAAQGDDLSWTSWGTHRAADVLAVCVSERVLAAARVPVASDDLEIPVDDTTIVALARTLLVIVTADGAPLAGARVVFRPRSATAALTRETDAAGRIVVDGIPRARLELTVMAPGRVPHRQDLQPDDRGPISIDLRPAVRIQGRVLSGGLPAEDAVQVRAWPVRDPAESGIRDLVVTWSGRDGQFEFSDLAPGDYVLSLDSARSRLPDVGAARDGKLPGTRYVVAFPGDATGITLATEDVVRMLVRRLEDGSGPGSSTPVRRYGSAVGSERARR